MGITAECGEAEEEGQGQGAPAAMTKPTGRKDTGVGLEETHAGRDSAGQGVRTGQALRAQDGAWGLTGEGAGVPGPPQGLP